MPRARLHAFEGEQLTVQQIHLRVPILSERTIRDHLAAGRRTRSAMLCFDPIAAAARGGRITQRILRARSTAACDS
ncbi:hypothetical protein E5C33_04550 [Stenotrophomonas maltophilia]|uniref:hypothetical protein n=1 Tax=Stenotrophomonas maltophilia TaxID=40324 RepID=UPI0010763DA3|nr:hypothetical protein [Stenotrophomonas maltophilia]TFZ46470.1 hypothetical protein E5C33_04550 [Stenotrophomonas maltophilia]